MYHNFTPQDNKQPQKQLKDLKKQQAENQLKEPKPGKTAKNSPS